MRMRIRDPQNFLTLDPGWNKYGSGKNIPDPQHFHKGRQGPMASHIRKAPCVNQLIDGRWVDRGRREVVSESVCVGHLDNRYSVQSTV
jgi:hypothetical protein